MANGNKFTGGGNHKMNTMLRQAQMMQEEMERRFSLFEKECVSDVGEYNKKAADKLSTIIALVSYEASKDAIKGLLGKCVAAGISLLVYANSLDSVDEETKSLTTLLE